MHNQDDSYSFITRAEKLNFEYYNSLLQNAGLKLVETPEDWWCNEWSMESNDAQALLPKIKTCIASIMQNYALEKPTEILEEMSFNTMALIKKREFGDSLEGQQKFKKWAREEWNKRTNNLKKSYAIKQVFASGLQNARKMLHNASEQFILCIPYNLVKVIMDSRDRTYICKYDVNKPLNEQKISKEALNIIAKLHLDYWCNSQKEREELYAILQENEKRANDQLLKNMFKKL